MADDFCTDDRRRVINAGIRHGRDAEVANLQAAVDAGFTNQKSVVIAVRGERLTLTRISGRDAGSGEFIIDVLAVVEVNSDNEIAAIVAFDPDDFGAAIAELDARYLAGEAAPYARTWSVITETYAAMSRHEHPALTSDCASIDHRRVTAFAPGELPAYIRAGWDLGHDLRPYVEVVHRLSDFGAVCGSATRGVSHEGFDAEWREIALTTVNGDMVNRCELFDEADLDTAIARFDQLSQAVPRLENAATRVWGRIQSYFAVRDWDAMANTVAADMLNDDRRRLVNSGIRHGRDVEIANGQAFVDIGGEKLTSTVIAVRGGRLALCRSSLLGQGPESEAFRIEFLSVVETDANERLAAHLAFDLEDFHAAITELDARYLAGEAAPHARTWSVITAGFAALNRRELPPTTPDWVNIDHRRGTSIAPGEMTELLSVAWNFTSDLTSFIETVHRLNNLGAVVTHMSHETSQEGFHAEWRVISVLTLEGAMINRCEVFDEAALDAAIARFDQLGRAMRGPTNTASQVVEGFLVHFAARDWPAMTEMLADDSFTDDRRRIVGVGTREGRELNIADWRAVADIGTKNIAVTVIATRGQRLVLGRYQFLGRDTRSESFHSDVLGVVEINADNRVTASVMFDLEDIDAAFEELDARPVKRLATRTPGR